MALLNETYIRIFSGAASAALQEMMKRGGSVEQIAEDAVMTAVAFADCAIENDAVAMQDGRSLRMQIAAQLMAALLEPMQGHTPHTIARRAVELADALIDVVDE